MRKLVVFGLVFLASLSLTACGQSGPKVDLNQVLQRTAETFVKFDSYMTRYDYRSLSPQLLEQLSIWLNKSFNDDPKLYKTPIAAKFYGDASMKGHADLNHNGKVDPKEPVLFRVEFDSDNMRLIATGPKSNSGYGYRPRSSGFMTGVLVGSMLGRQREAGIRYGHFRKRAIRMSALSPSDEVSKKGRKGRRRSARGRARSGGVRGGK